MKYWNEVKLKSLLTMQIQNGYSPNCPETPNGKWILGLATLTENGLDVTKAKPAPLKDKKVNDFILKTGDFLISRSNTLDKVGRSALFKGDLENCSYPDLMMRFRVDESKAILGYLERYLRSERVVKHFQKCASGTSETMVKITKSAVENLIVVLPPLPKQTAIADLLSTWDAAIEKTERLIAAKERRFRGMLDMVAMKNKTDEWREVRLGEAFAERTEIGRDELPLLSITREDGIVNREDTNRKDTSTEDKSKYLRICKGDIGYNTMRMWQGVSALSNLEGIVSPAYTICIPNLKIINPEYASYLFKHSWMIHQFYRHSQGLTSDTWNLKYHHFAEIKITLPTLKKQSEIVIVLSNMKKEINLLKQITANYKKQKRGLMQKLLTGTWRVKVKN